MPVWLETMIVHDLSESRTPAANSQRIRCIFLKSPHLLPPGPDQAVRTVYIFGMTGEKENAGTGEQVYGEEHGHQQQDRIFFRHISFPANLSVNRTPRLSEHDLRAENTSGGKLSA